MSTTDERVKSCEKKIASVAFKGVKFRSYTKDGKNGEDDPEMLDEMILSEIRRKNVALLREAFNFLRKHD